MKVIIVTCILFGLVGIYVKLSKLKCSVDVWIERAAQEWRGHE